MIMRHASALFAVLATLSCSLFAAPAAVHEEIPAKEKAAVLDIVFQLQFAAESGNADALRDLLDEDTFTRLSLPGGGSSEDLMETLRLVAHRDRFHRVLEVGGALKKGGRNCYQIILPREGRYGYVDGPIEAPFGQKRIDFWLCLTEGEEGESRVYLAFPLNDLVCLIQ